MIPQINQHVKCVFRNGTVVEGIVEEWTNNIVQLKSLDSKSILIIMRPSEDIMLIKILLNLPDNKIDINKDSNNDFANVVQESVVDYNKPDEVKSLAELRIELAKQERKILAEKLREHRPSKNANQPTATYHYPSVITGKPLPYQPSKILRPGKKSNT